VLRPDGPGKDCRAKRADAPRQRLTTRQGRPMRLRQSRGVQIASLRM
jgi:hypothetical protein